MLAEMRVRVLRQTVRGDDQVWLLDAKTSTVWDQTEKAWLATTSMLMITGMVLLTIQHCYVCIAAAALQDNLQGVWESGFYRCKHAAYPPLSSSAPCNRQIWGQVKIKASDVCPKTVESQIPTGCLQSLRKGTHLLPSLSGVCGTQTTENDTSQSTQETANRT